MQISTEDLQRVARSILDSGDIRTRETRRELFNLIEMAIMMEGFDNWIESNNKPKTLNKGRK